MLPFSRQTGAYVRAVYDSCVPRVSSATRAAKAKASPCLNHEFFLPFSHRYLLSNPHKPSAFSGDGLWTTLVIDRRGTALGVCYSNGESLREAVQRQAGVYWSRQRGLWIKGQTSGATQVQRKPCACLLVNQLFKAILLAAANLIVALTARLCSPRRFTALATTATVIFLSLPSRSTWRYEKRMRLWRES